MADKKEEKKAVEKKPEMSEAEKKVDSERRQKALNAELVPLLEKYNVSLGGAQQKCQACQGTGYRATAVLVDGYTPPKKEEAKPAEAPKEEVSQA